MDFPQHRPWNRDGFEIAIICALPRETNAVLCSMDEIWHDCRHYYGKSAGDDNSYDFGEIGNHSVVIVTLPNMGLVKSSSASRSLKMSFSSIKLALLVGMCGAVPFKKDGSEIVLGDVIISETIVELDYGRQYSDSFRRKNALLDVHGRPNEEILGLLQRWKIPVIFETLRQGSMRHLNALLQTMNTNYPGVRQDILFQPDYIHKHRGKCMECSDVVGSVCQHALTASCSDLCDESKIVPRHRLKEAAAKPDGTIPNPNIHIGPIGTGNAVMKSAQHRDQHAHSDGIIAFEMEGVGVWDKFNCLVIKGVCDYADSHKNKVWQEYAAAVAAAVAKEVLVQYVTPQMLPNPSVSNGELPRQNPNHLTGREQTR
ncbi:purine and uridine phosphorylase [Aspergillus steynii IBT 23096]|uniref:Purine and uridine phosphorylase n=1 Tax=Aspergillus steynii IBT 23096 TaxID=1392250 RepID=A0A2I2G6C3_9EURO|nr:purine and uridine phosphorylase [Aspergillus steynii IBT 23096]PLB48419.1 purine and uridine phosphorylase [Aspergillus steynii IBT 23096]